MKPCCIGVFRAWKAYQARPGSQTISYVTRNGIRYVVSRPAGEVTQYLDCKEEERQKTKKRKKQVSIPINGIRTIEERVYNAWQVNLPTLRPQQEKNKSNGKNDDSSLTTSVNDTTTSEDRVTNDYTTSSSNDSYYDSSSSIDISAQELDRSSDKTDDHTQEQRDNAHLSEPFKRNKEVEHLDSSQDDPQISGRKILYYRHLPAP